MTLEDFFTSTDLKDGLTTLDRVNEFISVIQSKKDSVDNNGEAIRHLSSVASIVAATENKNCLDQFINLDGLSLINKWLKDAQNLQNDDENGSLEELFILLLRALERLRLDNESSFSSEIRNTVEELGSHSSSMVREKAKSLSDSWMLIQEKDDESLLDVKNLESIGADSSVTRQPDDIVDLATTNQDIPDHADPSCKLTAEDENLLIKFKVQNSISEGVEKSDVKDENEKEISFHDKGDLVEILALPSPSAEIAPSAAVNNCLESSRETDVLSDKDEDMVDNGESPKASSSSESDTEGVNEDDGVQSNENLESGSRLFKLSMDSKTSDMKLDFGMIDPLDIARQVANEVELEVDSRERSCSTSEKMSDSGTVKRSRESTPESKNGQESQSLPVGGSDKVTSGLKPEPVKDAEILVSEKMLNSGTVKRSRESTPESKNGQESQSLLVSVSDKVTSGPKPEPVKEAETLVSQISEVAQESEPGAGRGFSGFDLNEEVCSEEVDNPINPVSSTISIVSPPRAAVASQLPDAIHFEGSGLKELASTSETHNNFKKRLDFLDIDLNVADGSEDKMVIVSDLPSAGESSVRRFPERPQLDLNSTGNDPNGWLSPSSSSSKQHSRRNIDLNINSQPIFPNDAAVDHSVISIFGKKVEVKGKSSFQPTMDFNLGRPVESSMQYGNPNPSFYGHHNGMYVYPMPMYALSPDGKPVPYRGGSFVPQLMASQQPPSPFMMNMAAPGASSSSNGVGPSYPYHNFDINTGLTINGGNRETIVGLRQFFPQNVDEQYMRENNSLQQAPSSSIVGGKRPEPHSGFEFFPVNKHHQPPWR
uniref:uncharacterized protein LOC122589850 n=1 Tax=Erigeron canadensis TaxID=72917 RepID=UPI001CB8D94C|nr:uncharacterized protein LOC122589850 [Erigeron canadensis]XP_043618105.1 uncharacterized protein LOC122589850 [Erigeron canadensis]